MSHVASLVPLARSIPRLSPSPLVTVFLLGDALVGLAALVAFVFGGDDGSTLLKVGEESNVPTWFSSSQLLAIGLVLAALAVRDVRFRRPATWGLALVPLLFTFLSLDETAMLHERLGDEMAASMGVGLGLRTGPWMFAFVPLVLLLGGAAAWALRPYLRRRPDALLLLGAGVLLYGLSAVGFEFVANFVGGGSLTQKGLGFAEELGEMVGATVLLWGGDRLVRHEGIRLEWGMKGG